MLTIINHKLVDPEGRRTISYMETPNHSGRFTGNLPDTVVIHYTAGASLKSSANWLTDRRANASAHLVIGKWSEMIQLAPFNVRTWHAGISSWKGRYNLNNYSIGIELDNAGILEKREDGYYTAFNKKIDLASVVLARHKLDTSEKAWEAFPWEQIEAVIEACQLLKNTYNIREIVGHDDISPTRKRDPGPAFPMQYLKSRLGLE